MNADVGGAAGSRSSLCIETAFNQNDTDYEAGCNTFDSGGAVFSTNSAGEWAVAGVNVYRLGNAPDFTGNDAVKVLEYKDWIIDTIGNYDTDHDFLPDWWENQYGGDDTSMDPEADGDNDGFDNLDEWLSDTDPTDSASHFKVIEWNAPTNVVFTTSTNREYAIEYRNNLGDPSEDWTVEQDWQLGENGQMSLPLVGSASNRAFRVRARLPR